MAVTTDRAILAAGALIAVATIASALISAAFEPRYQIVHREGPRVIRLDQRTGALA